ncbi:DNA and RNA helicase [Treponema primitia ZAS-2]|uniref:DNA 3'-5' helicase n=2 Tax=Treponema primitia TaxID=88058 RepID=F5YJE0_TREPZ|nr:DNA and RNA helicase [Treponema primitia ZAS-2]
MRIIADLHIHSPYSRATSRRNSPAILDRWARIKGIGLAGTGDCTHPQWLSDLRESLVEVGEGFYALKEDLRRDFDRVTGPEAGLPNPGSPPGDMADSGRVRFVLTGEISTIYSRDGKTRKVHHLVVLPDFEAAAAFQGRLEKAGNIRSDGRPILGLDSRDLLEMLLESDRRSMLIPAHIWTPWFSALGRSGFDSIDECYRDLAPHIHAIETGLSSNPPMNWALSSLDRFAIISNSDAHSPDKLGREATVLSMEPSYPGLAAALSGASGTGILETVEFFPQEGKYHYDGHRVCDVSLDSESAAAAKGLCPVCGKALTPGVLSRVRELADRPVSETAPCPADSQGTNRRPYRSLIPLVEILGELLSVGAASKKVSRAYGPLIEKGGGEFSILMDKSIGELEKLNCPGISGELLAAAIDHMRRGEVFITPGYDGLYGVIRAFPPGKVPGYTGPDLFGDEGKSSATETLPSGTMFPVTALLPSGTAALTADNSAKGDGNQETAMLPSETTSLSADNGAKSGERPRENSVKQTEPWAPAKTKMANQTPDALSPASSTGPRPAAKPASLTLSPAPPAFTPDQDQERAIHHSGGPALIIAGPGTGKTSVLARRITRLMEHNPGTEEPRILALSFTVKAAEELRDRIVRTTGKGADGLTVGTFHSLGRSILKAEAAAAGIREDFGILDEEGKTALLRDITTGKKPAVSPEKLGSYIEERKRFLLLPGETIPRLSPPTEILLDGALRETAIPPLKDGPDLLYREYRDALKLRNALDFDDLLAGTVRLLVARPELLKKHRDRFTHIFADEYQDINFAQYALLRLLGRKELWVIGDPNQAIYGFRGASNKYMDRFLSDYPGAAIYRLTKSFRCADPIIQAANALTGAELRGADSATCNADFSRQVPRATCNADFSRQVPRAVTLYRTPCPTDRAEAEGIARRISALIGGTGFFAIDSGIANSSAAEDSGESGENGLTSLGQCAILIRAAALAAPFEEALQNHGIPYRLMGENLEDLKWSTEEVALMTIHASKGLEFDHVFVTGLEEGILPFTLFGESNNENIDEEKRLLYVAMTRARYGLHLSWAASRIFRGRKLTQPPSRFLSSLEALIPELKPSCPRREKNPQLNLFD